MKRIKYTLAIVTFIINVFQCYSQSNSIFNGHSINGVITHSILSDAQLELSGEKFLSGGFTYRYRNAVPSGSQSFTVGWQGGSSKNNLKKDAITLDYTTGFSLLGGKTSGWNYFVGYSVAANMEFIRAADRYSWASTTALGLYTSVDYSNRKNEISFSVKLPVAGLASGPSFNSTYKGNADEMFYNSYSNLVFVAPHNFRAVTASLQAGRSLSDRIAWNAGLVFSYRRLEQDYLFRQKDYGFYTGLIYRLR